MKKKNVVKKGVREKKTLHRTTVKHVKPAVVQKIEPKVQNEPVIEPVIETPTVEDLTPKKSRKNKPVQPTEENIEIENN